MRSRCVAKAVRTRVDAQEAGRKAQIHGEGSVIVHRSRSIEALCSQTQAREACDTRHVSQEHFEEHLITLP